MFLNNPTTKKSIICGVNNTFDERNFTYDDNNDAYTLIIVASSFCSFLNTNELQTYFLRNFTQKN